jgi:hypothetical protein
MVCKYIARFDETLNTTGWRLIYRWRRELVLPMADHIAPSGYRWSRCGGGISNRLCFPVVFRRYHRLRLNGTARAHLPDREGLVGDRRGLDSRRLCESSAIRGNAELSRRRNPEYFACWMIARNSIQVPIQSKLDLCSMR